MTAEKVTNKILAIHDEYEQAYFNYQEYGGDWPKELEYFKREVAVVQQYADEVSQKECILFWRWLLKQDNYTLNDNSPKELHKLWKSKQ